MEVPQALTFRFDPCAAPVAASERAARLVDPGFGRVFTDHMALIRYSDEKGWHDAQITARARRFSSIRPLRSCIMRRKFSRA